MMFLFGASVQQAKGYAKVHHMDMSKVKLIYDEKDLFGQIHGTPIVFVGTWWENEHAIEIERIAKSIGMMCLVEMK